MKKIMIAVLIFLILIPTSIFVSANYNTTVITDNLKKTIKHSPIEDHSFKIADIVKEQSKNSNFDKLIEFSYDVPSNINNNLDNIPPTVDILNPLNNTIINENNSEVQIKVSDDTGVWRLLIKWGSFDGAIGSIVRGFYADTSQSFYETTLPVYPGYNWILAVVYDKNGNMDYDLSIYYYETHEKPYPQGLPPNVEITFPWHGLMLFDKSITFSTHNTDKNSIKDYYSAGIGKYYCWGHGLGSRDKGSPFYFNKSVNVSEKHNVFFAIGTNPLGKMDFDLSVVYYNSSEDIFPPKIELIHPTNGLYLLGNYQKDLEVDYPVIIGDFKITTLIQDKECHLENVSILINDLIVKNFSFYRSYKEKITWDCDLFLFGMKKITIIAKDSYDNKVREEFDCFVINIK